MKTLKALTSEHVDEKTNVIFNTILQKAGRLPNL